MPRPRSLVAFVLLLAGALPGAASAHGQVPAGPPSPAPPSSAPRPAAPASGTVTGSVVAVGPATVTVRVGGARMGVGAALAAAAGAVGAGDYPYVYGGGHLAAGTPSPGLAATSARAHRHGPGVREVGYDCSGSIAAVLAGAGLWPAGAGVPSDAGMIAELRASGIIARGPGAVTLWDDPGVHIFLQLGTRFFGTSDGMGGSPLNPNDGAGWLDDGAPDTQVRAFHAWHVVAGALAHSFVYGPTVTVGLGALDPAGFVVGGHVSLRWRLAAGSPVAAALLHP